ncbi:MULTISPECIES: CinA family protein [unclassified Devosia]|uniref:CinA family protein n=1 Tax=unclassified Devosia TaxID=196773 RepID=UPI00145C4458|nr:MULTISPECIES: CinA family protein [unclassified Devosia]MBJ6986248.1 CinA family protein [Devosia sp. MC521]MBJ7576360.1 CinA family protein [Devosia sp. MC532]MBK1793048.1 CinA family protein [Devosia sp. WQ 349K1]QMW64268.1 CinA family protein [Devosia sp. MC521]
MASKSAPLSTAKRVISALSDRKLSIVTAESCTGGMIAAALTDVPGSSAALFGGFITYSNEAKASMIHVQPRLIQDYGAVSNQVARAMADGARNTANADIAVSSTGIAGPDGGSDKKPVGLVYVAVSTELATVVIEHQFGDIGRDEIRKATVEAALELVLQVVSSDDD